MLTLLPRGWVVEVIPLTVEIRGHLQITPRDAPGIRPEPREVPRMFLLRSSRSSINLFHTSYRSSGTGIARRLLTATSIWNCHRPSL